MPGRIGATYSKYACDPPYGPDLLCIQPFQLRRVRRAQREAAWLCTHHARKLAAILKSSNVADCNLHELYDATSSHPLHSPSHDEPDWSLGSSTEATSKDEDENGGYKGVLAAGHVCQFAIERGKAGGHQEVGAPVPSARDNQHGTDRQARSEEAHLPICASSSYILDNRRQCYCDDL